VMALSKSPSVTGTQGLRWRNAVPIGATPILAGGNHTRDGDATRPACRSERDR
jgi:hypothetical protein